LCVDVFTRPLYKLMRTRPLYKLMRTRKFQADETDCILGKQYLSTKDSSFWGLCLPFLKFGELKMQRALPSPSVVPVAVRRHLRYNHHFDMDRTTTALTECSPSSEHIPSSTH
jgi:hypothetical protein